MLPWLFPVLAKSTFVRHFMFRTVSQTAVRQRSSPLSEGRAGRLRGSGRLPWIVAEVPMADRAYSFAPLSSRDWQVHVYGGKPAQSIAEVRGKKGLALHVFP